MFLLNYLPNFGTIFSLIKKNTVIKISTTKVTFKVDFRNVREVLIDNL